MFFVVCRLNQKSMAVVMWRTIHQRMSLLRGTALSGLICLLLFRFTVLFVDRPRGLSFLHALIGVHQCKVSLSGHNVVFSSFKIFMNRIVSAYFVKLIMALLK